MEGAGEREREGGGRQRERGGKKERARRGRQGERETERERRDAYAARCLAAVRRRRWEERRRWASQEERQKGRRKECICGLLDRVGGRVRRLGRALARLVGALNAMERIHRPDKQPGAAVSRSEEKRRNERANERQLCLYYRIHRRELTPRDTRAATATRWEFAALAYTRAHALKYASASTRICVNINTHVVYGGSRWSVGRSGARVYTGPSEARKQILQNHPRLRVRL